METRRICPKCRKVFPDDAVVCEECEELLVDAALDFEASLSMVKDPVLLSNGRGVDTMYLEEALKKRDIPYYVESGEHSVPTGNIKEGTVMIVPFTNYYVDKSSWRIAKEALLRAKEETDKNNKAPVKFIDTPVIKPEDELEEDSRQDRERRRNPWSWFVGLDTTVRLVVGAAAVVFLLGLYAVLFT